MRQSYRPSDYEHLAVPPEVAARAIAAGLTPGDMESHTDRWCHGDCHELTVALLLRFGWQPWIFACGDGVPLHSGVVLPDGRLLDMRGARPEAEMVTVCSGFWRDGAITSGLTREELCDIAGLWDIDPTDDADAELLEDANAVIEEVLTVLEPQVASAIAEYARRGEGATTTPEPPPSAPAPATPTPGRGSRR